MFVPNRYDSFSERTCPLHFSRNGKAVFFLKRTVMSRGQPGTTALHDIFSGCCRRPYGLGSFHAVQCLTEAGKGCAEKDKTHGRRYEHLAEHEAFFLTPDARARSERQ